LLKIIDNSTKIKDTGDTEGHVNEINGEIDGCNKKIIDSHKKNSYTAGAEALIIAFKRFSEIFDNGIFEEKRLPVTRTLTELEIRIDMASREKTIIIRPRMLPPEICRIDD